MDNVSACENVIVVVADALRSDRVGALEPSRQELTPNINRLAKEGVVFDRAFSCVNTTAPSITSIHTGRYPRSTVVHHGSLVTEAEKQRVEGVEFVPELLSGAGYKTIGTGRRMGRWRQRGFDSHPGSATKSRKASISEKLESIHPILRRVASGFYNKLRSSRALTRQEESTPTEMEELLREIDESPFYGFIHLMDTHAWYESNEELVDELLEKNDYPSGDLEEFFDEYSASPVVENQLKPNSTPADYEYGISRICARYDASVRKTDEKIGFLIEELQKREIWDETALFVLSDHGESLTEHGIYFDHHGLYDETIHVPLIARVPGGKSGRINELVQLHDLAPTTLDLVGVDGLSNADGISLAGYLHDQFDVPPKRDYIFAEEAHAQRRRAVRSKRHKYIEYVDDEDLEETQSGNPLVCRYCDRVHGDPKELYNLKDDPGEKENISSFEECVTDELQSALEQFEDSHPKVDSDDSVPTYDDEEEVLSRLEDLGYR